MSSNSVLNAVQHYQRSIEKNPTDVARLLHCVGKLYKIPITVEHLQQTGVGRTVNALRKHEGELGVAAEAVVNKWKQLVAAESDIRAGNQSSENEQDVDDEDDDNNLEKNEQTYCTESGKTHGNEYTPAKQQVNSTNETEKTKNDTEHVKDTTKKHHKTSSSSHKNHDRHSHHKSEHKDRSKRHHDSKESHKKGGDREHKSHKNRNKSEMKEENDDNIEEKHRNSEHKSKTGNSTKDNESKEKVEHHSSSGKHHHEKRRDDEKKQKSKSKTHSNSEAKTPSSSTNIVKSTSNQPCSNEPSTSAAATAASAKVSSEKKRRHEDEEDKGKSPKKLKSNIHHNEKQHKQSTENTEGDAEDGIDSSMGANFADVLGMLNMPQKKVKKSLNAMKNTSPPKSAKKTPESDNAKSSSTLKANGIRNTEMPSSSSTSTSQRSLEKKPDLLTSKVKLPPLDPNIALELPIISNNYKPLPLNPTVMDCVFNSSTSSSSRAPPPRLLSDAEAISHGISSKTMRTKVYSGVKTGQLLQAPTLFDLCIRVLQKNIDALEYTGGVPFDVLRPVLERATPQQLFTFEEYNPYLMEDSDVLWKQHVERNYRSHKRQEMETWREMFMRCQEDQERRLSMLAENIKQSQKAIALPVRKTQLAFVDSMVKPPRGVMRKQEQYGTKAKPVATPAARVAALCNVIPNAAKQGDARLRVASAFAQDPAKLSGAPTRPKKAPLMAKTLQFMRGRLKR